MKAQQANIQSAFISGTDAVLVDVEAFIDSGMPSFTIIGMKAEAASETTQKVRCAVKSSGFEWPRGHIVVNLSPTHIKKSGSSFDLAIAAAVLAASGQVERSYFEDKLVVGELSLDGTVMPCIRGFVAYAVEAKAFGMTVCTSGLQGRVGCYMPDVEVDCIENLEGFRSGERGNLITHIEEEQIDSQLPPNLEFLADTLTRIVDARSGLLLMTNDPEKASAIAAYIRCQMGDPDVDELSEIAKAYSCANVIMADKRPLRSPHHSATLPGLIGGGNPIYPGEVTLAHGGVLFLDEFENFSPNAISRVAATRPERKVVLTRADGIVEMPADSIIIATAKPCPCGNYGDPDAECRCSEYHVMDYQRRIHQLADELGIGILDI